jgi:hypothetical protein
MLSINVLRIKERCVGHQVHLWRRPSREGSCWLSWHPAEPLTMKKMEFLSGQKEMQSLLKSLSI